MPTPLEGLIVLDLCHSRAGALASMLLSDLGARVLRAVGPRSPLMREGGFVVWDRGKEAIDLDVDASDVSEKLDGLLPGLDVLLEDFAPSSPQQSLVTRQRLDILNPALIHCSITAYGKHGPWKDDPPVDDLVKARAGILASMPGYRGTPLHLIHPLPSTGGALTACIGIAAALYSRTETGRGLDVNCSLLGGALVYTPKLIGDRAPDRMVQWHPGGTDPFFSVYECADGDWIQLACVHAGFIRACAELTGLTELISNPRFKGGRIGMPRDAEIELRTALADVIRTKPRTEWAQLLTQRDVPHAFVLHACEALEDPQVMHNGAVETLPDPLHGDVCQMGTPFRYRVYDTSPGEPRPDKISSFPKLEPIAIAPKGAPAARQPLAGVHIFEVANYIAGPASGRILSELGATVTKLEPRAGDLARQAGRPYFFNCNLDKRSLGLDVKTERGQEVLTRLLANCDGMISNLRPGATERMGAGKNANPDLVESHMSAFGWTGPDAKRPGLDPVAQATIGLHHAQGGRGNPPSCLNNLAPADYTTGILGALNMVMGLYLRAKTGVAESIESNLLDGAILQSSEWFTRYDACPPQPQSDGGQYGLTAFHRLYECTDGWIYLAADAPEHRDSVTGWLTLEPLDADGDHPAASPMAAAIAARLATITTADVETALSARNVPLAVVLSADFEAFLTHPHAIANGHPSPRNSDFFGEMSGLGGFIDFPGLTRTSNGGTPVVGEHTSRILSELGYSDEDIQALYAEGVIFTVPQ